MTDRFRLDGRVAVVTGALGHLGPVWVEALLEIGATVVGLDLPAATPTAAFVRLQSVYPDTLTLIAADVTDRTALVAARDKVLSEYAVPAVLVNNAGIDAPPSATGGGYRLDEIPFDVNRRIFEVNALGLFQVTQLFGT
jgi:NAD(P)-dependent dehydrogenase (short-subunit alcohol dehydrogenase family)